MESTRRGRTMEDRFWSKVDLNGPLPERRPELGRCWQWTAAVSSSGYGNFLRSKGVYVNPHRLSWEMARGPVPPGMQLDHLCHNRLCVNPAHMRAVTNKQNHENLSGPQRNNTSGVRGVHWAKSRRKWVARVQHDQRWYCVGSFATLAEAEDAVIAKRRELFTHNDLDRVVLS